MKIALKIHAVEKIHCLVLGSVFWSHINSGTHVMINALAQEAFHAKISKLLKIIRRYLLRNNVPLTIKKLWQSMLKNLRMLRNQLILKNQNKRRPDIWSFFYKDDKSTYASKGRALHFVFSFWNSMEKRFMNLNLMCYFHLRLYQNKSSWTKHEEIGR